MLQTIRDRLTGWVAVAILLIIALALVVTFGNMNSDVATGRFAAKVNGDEIPMLEFREAYQNQLLRQQEAFQGELPQELQQQLQRNVLEGLVQEKALLQFIGGDGYRVTDQQVASFVRSQPRFQVGGEFASQAYIATLASQGLTPEIFEERTRRALEINQLQVGLVGSSFYTPTEYRQFIELQQQQRAATLVQFSPAAFFSEVSLDDGAVEEYYSANLSQFQTEESVALDYVELRLADIAATVAVDDAALREYYDNNADRYSTAEERRSRHILIAVEGEAEDAVARDKAEKLVAEIAAGGDFSALARENSDDPGSAPDGGELGWAGRGVFVPAFEEALFALEVSEVSPPVRTEFGYHVIQLEELRSGSQRPFDDVREEILDQLQRQAAEDSFFEGAERLDDLALENPGGLAAVAEQSGLKLQRAEKISRSGGEPFGFNATIIEAAFSPSVLEDGENSPLLEIEDGRAVVLRVVEHRLPEPRSFEEVRAAIAGELRLQAAAELARERGQSALDRIRQGEDFALVAGEFGLAVQQPGLILRNSDVLPPELVAAVFRAPVPGAQPVIQGVESGDGGYAIFRIDQVAAGRPESVPRDQRDRAKAQLAGQLGNADFGSVVVDLRADADVAVAPDTLTEPESL